MNTKRRDPGPNPKIKITEHDKKVRVQITCDRKWPKRDPQTESYVFCDYDGTTIQEAEIEPDIKVPFSIRLVIEFKPDEVQKAKIRNILQDRRKRIIKD